MYIGITSKSKSGRQTAAWLLANLYEEAKHYGWLTFNKPESVAKKIFTKYKCLVDLAIQDPNEVGNSTEHCSISSISGNIYGAVHQLIGGDHLDLTDQRVREDYIISTSLTDILPIETATMSFVHTLNLEDIEPGKPLNKHKGYLKLSDFILWYAKQMKSIFGDDFWLRNFLTNRIPMGDEVEFIWDIRSKCECDWIKGAHGHMIELKSGKVGAKPGRYRDNIPDSQEWTLDTTSGLETYDTFQSFMNIVEKIIKLQ